MATATADLSILGIGDIAERTGAPTWAVRRVLDRLAFAKRFGPNRIIAEADLPIVAAELEASGYIDGPTEVVEVPA